MNPNFIKYGTPIIRLIEECSEVIQALCKADRFGLDDWHPETKITNRNAIDAEIKDLQIAIKNYRDWEKIIYKGSDRKRRDGNEK